MLPLGLAIPAALKVGKAIFGKKAEDKAGKEQQRANVAGGKLKAAVAEDQRLAHAGLGTGMAGSMASRGFMVPDAATLAALETRRNYDPMIEAAAADPSAGSGSAFLSGLFGTGSDLATEYNVAGDQPVSPDNTMGTGILVNAATQNFDPETGEPI
jgi:hypothetical protein